jgi:hypothetical protein
MGAVEGRRLRPAAFLSAGSRLTISDLDQEEPTATQRFVWGGGANLRAYTTPRYFLEAEGRVEMDAGDPHLLLGLGLGVHFGGKPEARRPPEEASDGGAT